MKMLVAVLINEKIKYGKEYRPNIQGCRDSLRNMVARKPMMAITISSSMSVKPD